MSVVAGCSVRPRWRVRGEKWMDIPYVDFVEYVHIPSGEIFGDDEVKKSVAQTGPRRLTFTMVKQTTDKQQAKFIHAMVSALRAKRDDIQIALTMGTEMMAYTGTVIEVVETEITPCEVAHCGITLFVGDNPEAMDGPMDIRT